MIHLHDTALYTFMAIEITHVTDDIQRHRHQTVSQMYDIWGPFYQHGLILILTCISNHRPSKLGDEITHPLPNFNGPTVKNFGSG